MRVKTIIIILVTILLTVIIMQNAGPVWFKILWMQAYVSKLFVMLIVAIVAFILGYLMGRPKRKFSLGETTASADASGEHPDTLSSEDREYIN